MCVIVSPHCISFIARFEKSLPRWQEDEGEEVVDVAGAGVAVVLVEQTRMIQMTK